MKAIDTIEALEAIYPDAPSPLSLTKVRDHLSPAYAKWIGASRFCILTTVGPEGTDSSPRGDDGPAAAILDAKTLAMPDWRGNNRLDSLRNIVRDGRGSLMFLVTGSSIVVRVNGQLRITDDAGLRAHFAKDDKQPRSVIVMAMTEVYFQCAKALMRSDLWARMGDADALPSAGELLREADGEIDAEAFDTGYAAYAATRMW